MKKLLTNILVAVISLTASANDCYFPVSITLKEDAANVDFKAVEALVRRSFSTENITASQNALFDVTILPQEFNSETISGIRPVIAVVYDLTFTISNTISHEQFGSATLRLAGSGKNLSTARKAAARSLKADNVDLVRFVKMARSNVVEYYDNNLDVILNLAKLSMELQQLEKSMWLLSSVPPCINRYNEVIALSKNVFDKYLTLDCREKVTNAQMAWAASPDQDGARLAFSYLAGVNPESSCNEEAQKLVIEIKDTIARLYADNKEKANEILALEMELKRTEMDNEKARIEAMRAIGIAYGNNQPENNTNIYTE